MQQGGDHRRKKRYKTNIFKQVLESNEEPSIRKYIAREILVSGREQNVL